MPVRKVVTRSGRRVRGYFPSVKNDRMVAWESMLERDAIILFEFSSAVVSYHEQPSIETYYEEDCPHRYFPDFLLVLQSEMHIHVEIKPEKQIEKQQIAARFDLIAKMYERRGRQFLLLTESDIRQEPRLSNLKLLAYHRRATLEGIKLDELLRPLEDAGSLSFATVSKLLGEDTMVYRLLAAGHLSCNLNEPILPSTYVHVSKAEGEYGSLHF